MANAYVDFTAANNGDGTTAAQASTGGGVGARNRLLLADFASGTTWDVWVRRAGTYSMTASPTWNQANIHFIGWPIVGDSDYSGRPASGTTNGWDSDSQTYAQITATSGVSITVPSGAGQAYRRLKFEGSSSTQAFMLVEVTLEMTNCLIHCSNEVGVVIDSLTIPNAVKGIFSHCTFITTTAFAALLSEFNCCSFLNCVMTAQSISGGTVLAQVFRGDQQLFEDCTFGTSGTCNEVALLQVLGDSSRSMPVFLGCSFDVSTATGWFPTIDVASGASFLSCSINGKQILIRGGSTTEPWTSSTFPIHFTNVTLGDGPTGRTNDAYINSSPDSTSIVFSGTPDTAQSADFVGVNVRFNQGGPNHCYHVIASWSGRYTFRNLQMTGPLFPITSAFAQPQNLTLFLDMPGVEVQDLQTVPGWARYNTGGRILPTTNPVLDPPGAHGPTQEFLMPQYGYGGFWGGLYYVPQFIDDDRLFVFLTAGIHTITVRKNAGTDDEDVWFEIDYLDTGSGGHRATASSYVLQQGVSAGWANLTVSITVGQDCWGPVRLFYSSIDSACFFDPQAVVS